MVKGFTTRKVYFDVQGKEGYKLCNSFHWSWHDDDKVYYRDDVDDRWYMDVPSNGTKAYSLKLGKTARILVTIDK